MKERIIQNIGNIYNQRSLQISQKKYYNRKISPRRQSGHRRMVGENLFEI